MGMELELSALIGGRKVDLNTPLCLSRFSCDGGVGRSRAGECRGMIPNCRCASC
jgi:hypothetical protein